MTAQAADVLSPSSIVVGASAPDKAAAIEQVGAILVRQGSVTNAYIDAMRAREAIISTYLGNGIALPHGTSEAQEAILRTGLAVGQFPDGVPWGDERARIVIALAARSEEHIGILSRLAAVLEDAELCEQLARTNDPLEIHRALTSDTEPPRPRPAPDMADGAISRTVRIVNPSGLHARPAAEIVERVLDADAEVTIVAGDRQANAVSITQVIALGASVGDEVTVKASGAEAEAAMDAVLGVLLAEG
jgi:phosphocarrier protein FPr